MTAFRFSLVALLALASASVFAQTASNALDPRQILSQIQTIRVEAAAKQRRGEQVSEVAVQGQIDKLVQDSIRDLDVKGVPSSDAYSWMQVFQYTRREDDIATLAEKAYGGTAFQLMEMDTYLVSRLIQQGKLAEAQSHIRNTAFGGGPSMIGQFSLGIQRALAGQATSHLSEVVSIYDSLIERVHYGSPLTPQDKAWGPVVYADLASKKYAALYVGGQKDRALKGLAALKKEMDKHPESKDAYAQSASSYVAKMIAQLTGPETQGALAGKVAPTLVSDRHLGDFGGVETLKGKVVVLDFMAHWCGPCKAALPELVKLQAALGSKGLQVVSLTGYYGYFGARQGITKDQEFEAMKGFVKDYQMSWPVLFDGTTKNNANYGVTGIPQLVVIDRKGIVRKIDIGYTPESFAATTKVIESLLASQ